jgi:hypothetical protein
MRSKLLFLIVLILAMAALPGTVCANLLPNPGFEDLNSDNSPWVDTLYPDEWGGWDPGGSHVWIETGGFNGSGLELTATAGTGSFAWPIGTGATSDIPIDPAKDYFFAVKAKGGTSLDFKIEWYAVDGASGVNVQGFTPATHATGPDWRQLQTGPVTPLAGSNFARFVMINFTTGTTVTIDDAWVDTFVPSGGSGVHSPSPADGASVVPVSFPTCVDLRWTRLKGKQGDDLSCKLYWNAGSADMNDVNFEPITELTPLTEPNAYSCVTVVAEKNYYWRVDCEDPNGGNGGVDTLIGPVWHFTTVNTAPEVDAGLKQAMWQDSGANPVTFQLAPIVSDDGLPVPPGSLTYLWTKTAGTGVVTFTPSPNVEAPTASMSVVDDYELTLTVSDGSGDDGSDSVKLRVHANATTGLEGRYDMDEGATAPLVHDDFSGNARHGDRMAVIDGVGVKEPAAPYTGTTFDITGGHINDGGGPNQGALVIHGNIPGYVELIASTNGDPNYNDCEGAGCWPGPSWADFEDEVTLAAWIKVDPDEGGFDDNWESIIVKGYPGAYRLERNAGTDGVQFSVDVDTAADGVAGDDDDGVFSDATYAAWGGMNVNDGEWHHVMGTYDGAHICIYVDGIEDSCVETEGAQIALNGGSLTIGANTQTDEPQAFGGTIDEARIHDIGLPYASDKPEAAPLTPLNARSVLSIYRTSGGHVSCADENGDGYYNGDVNKDCYVDLKDIKAIAEIWLDCNDIGNENCIP